MQLPQATDATGHPQGCYTEPGDLEQSAGLGTLPPTPLMPSPPCQVPVSLSVAFEVLLPILISSASSQATVSLVTLLDSIFWWFLNTRNKF